MHAPQRSYSRPHSSLSEHIAREFQRDFPRPPSARSRAKKTPLKNGAKRIKRFVFATAVGIKRIAVGKGQKTAKSVSNFSTRSIKIGAPRKIQEEIKIYPPQQERLYSPNSLNVHPSLTPRSIDHHALPTTITPANSIEEILDAYGVQRPSPLSTHNFQIPPPPARAIFPPESKYFSRIHTRTRPGSTRPYSRSSNRPFNSSRPSSSHSRYLRVPSVTSRPSTGYSGPSRPSTARSDTSSDILGLTPLYEETGEMPSPLLRRRRNGVVEGKRPETAVSNVPKVRKRVEVAVVVTRGTQTSPTAGNQERLGEMQEQREYNNRSTEHRSRNSYSHPVGIQTVSTVPGQLHRSRTSLPTAHSGQQSQPGGGNLHRSNTIQRAPSGQSSHRDAYSFPSSNSTTNLHLPRTHSVSTSDQRIIPPSHIQTPSQSNMMSYNDPHRMQRDAARNRYEHRTSSIATIPQTYYPPLPAAYTIYNPSLDPRLSHFSVDTHHTRHFSHPSQPPVSTFVDPRLSQLPTTADRYHTSYLTQSSNPTAHHRRAAGLSIDTTISNRTRRTSFGAEWKAPILRGETRFLTHTGSGGNST